jgi:hypothetical protein
MEPNIRSRIKSQLYPRLDQLLETLPGERAQAILAELRQRRARNETIPKPDYKAAADELVVELSPEELPFLNGIAYGGRGFVRSDLPGQAKPFVVRHELEHLLQTGQERNKEFSANVAAAREYPLGLLQTITFSLKERRRYHGSVSSYVAGLWNTFKTYFLPFKG